MKKFTLVFGSLFIASSLAATSLAHYFYQNHQHEDLAARPHSERIAPLGYYRTLTRDYYRCGQQGCSDDVNVSIPRTPAGSSVYSLRNQNTSDVSQMTRRANTYQERYLVIQKGNYVDRLGYDPQSLKSDDRLYSMADAGDYTLGSPRGFLQSSAGDFRAPGTSLAYRVLGLDTGNCNVRNFWTCGQSQNQTFRNSDAFSFVRNTKTSLRWNQTNQNTFDYFPTITESFDTVVNGRAYTYYTYTALNPSDNTMIRIEAVSSSAEKETASQRAFQIFETFRFN